MTDQNKLKKLFSQLDKHQLPGFDAHVELTPYRKEIKPAINNENVKTGAVAVIISFYSKSPSVILTKRASYDGVHGGQISFPGGKMDTSDLDLLHTAQRETREETGIILDTNNCLTKLSEIFIPPSNFIVHPFLFVNTNKFIGIENNEVDYLIEMPLTELMHDSALISTDIKLHDGIVLKDAPCFGYKNEIIWGATAAILNELRWLIKRI